MARHGRKAAKIREALENNPQASVQEIIDMLAAQRVRVTKAHVYNIRSRLGQPAAKTSSRAPGSSLDRLVQAKKLADAMGGIDEARAALSALAKLL
jgi:hypothetical protein